MAGSTLNQFQVKDLYQPLHATEEYYLKGLDVKKSAQFDDVILDEHGNDPYYHKNTYNLSQSIHHINYIIHPIQVPFGRPELDEAYMNAKPPYQTDPSGSVIFYPSFLTGQFVDNPKRERVFEKMLLRIKDDYPSEQQQIQSLQDQIEEADNELSILRSQIDYRLDNLKEKKETFENFYRNLCHWFFLGELKNPDEKAGIFFDEGGLTGPFDSSKINGLLSIYNKIKQLNQETKDSLSPLINTFESEYSNDKNQETKKMLDQQQKEIKEMEEINKRIEAELILQEAKYQSFRENYNKLLVLANKLRAELKVFLDKWYDIDAEKSKIDEINYCPKAFVTDNKLSWYNLGSVDLSSKDFSVQWVKNINKTYYDEIQVFNKQVEDAYDCIQPKRNKLNKEIIQLRENLTKLRDIRLSTSVDEINEKRLNKVFDDVEAILNHIVQKRFEHSNYNLLIQILKQKPQYGPNINPFSYIDYTIFPKNGIYLIFRSSYSKGQSLLLRKFYFNEAGEKIREVDYPPVKEISSPHLMVFPINEDGKETRYYIKFIFDRNGARFKYDIEDVTAT